MDSIIERIRFSAIVNCKFIRFNFIPRQISFFCGCQTDFSEFIIKAHRVNCCYFQTGEIRKFCTQLTIIEID